MGGRWDEWHWENVFREPYGQEAFTTEGAEVHRGEE
jgi:hypothetical protein